MLEVLLLSFDKDFTLDLIAFRIAEEAQGQFRAPGPHQTRKADDLTSLDVEVHILEDIPSHCGVVGVPILDLKHDFATALRADDENFDAFGQQRFDVRFLLGGITLAEENFDFIAGSFERFLETCLILDPAGFILGWKYDPDG